MSRSKWKIPLIDTNYLKKNQYIISRNSVITPKLVGLTVNIYNGKTYTELAITKDMLGHKCGEFAFTRSVFSFKKKKKSKNK
jgi:ribosomal protein S19